MNAKRLGLPTARLAGLLALILLFPITASATAIYGYTSGPISSVFDPDPLTFLRPTLGADITGVITLSQPLPENGTVTVAALSTFFHVPTDTGGGYGQTTQDHFLGASSSFTFETRDGLITFFSFDVLYPGGPIIDMRADSSSDVANFVFATPIGGVTATAGAGEFFSVPEPASLALFGLGLLVIAFYRLKLSLIAFSKEMADWVGP